MAIDLSRGPTVSERVAHAIHFSSRPRRPDPEHIIASPSATPGATGNRFLDSLPLTSSARITPFLESLNAASGTIIATRGAELEKASFPVNSVISAMTRMHDGLDIEVTLIGTEGFSGVQLALGDNVSGNEAVVQIPDHLWQMKSADFVACLAADPILQQRALRYAQATLETIAQFSGCNRLHPINERCARWLLMAHDRVADDTILLTHEYLATMLGVRRPGVSLAAAALDQAGLIEYHRGRIFIRDRRGLEAVACECYGVANDAVERLLGYDIRKPADSGGEQAVG